MILLWNVIVLYVRSGTGPGPATPIDPRLTSHIRLVSAWSILIVLTGTVVTGTGPNGGDSRADRLGYALETVAKTHSTSVWIFLAILIALAWRVARSEHAARLSRSLRPLIVVTVLQGMIGYLQYFTGVPPLLVLAHIIGATTLFCGVVWTHLAFFERPVEALTKP